MVVQPPQTRVCLSCQSLEASSRTAQLAVEIARLNAALRNGSRLDWRLARRPTASRSFLSGAGRALRTGYGRSSGA